MSPQSWKGRTKNKNVRNTNVEVLILKHMDLFWVVSSNAHGPHFPVGVKLASSWPTQASISCGTTY